MTSIDYSKVDPNIKRELLKVLKTVFTVTGEKGNKKRLDFIPGDWVELYVTNSPVPDDSYALWTIIRDGHECCFYMEPESIDEFIEGASFLWQEYQDSRYYNFDD